MERDRLSQWTEPPGLRGPAPAMSPARSASRTAPQLLGRTATRPRWRGILVLAEPRLAARSRFLRLRSPRTRRVSRDYRACTRTGCVTRGPGGLDRSCVECAGGSEVMHIPMKPASEASYFADGRREHLLYGGIPGRCMLARRHPQMSGGRLGQVSRRRVAVEQSMRGGDCTD